MFFLHYLLPYLCKERWRNKACNCMSLKQLKKSGGLYYSFESLGLTPNSSSNSNSSFCKIGEVVPWDNGIHELSWSVAMNIVWKTSSFFLDFFFFVSFSSQGAGTLVKQSESKVPETEIITRKEWQYRHHLGEFTCDWGNWTSSSRSCHNGILCPCEFIP